MSRRLNFGLLIADINGSYQEQLINGAVSVSNEKNINLFVFVGGRLEPGMDYSKDKNVIFKHVNKDRIDGIIIATSNLEFHTTNKQMEDFFYSFNIPCISISIPVKNIPTIILNNRKGMYDLSNHLIKFHNYKNIAFIGGPGSNEEAAERLEVFKEALKENKQEFNYNYYFEGDFTSRSGIKAIKFFIDDKKLNIDAIICANDAMAYGAYCELKRRKFKIPEQIAITGFDDLAEYRYVYPSFTTVRQPIYNQLAMSVSKLIQLIESPDTNINVTYDTELIVRDSCGCKLAPKKNDKNNSFDITNITEFKNMFYKNVSKTIYFLDDNKTFKNILNNIIDVFINDILNNSTNKDFIKYIRETLDTSNIQIYREIILAIYKEAYILFNDNKYIQVIESNIKNAFYYNK